MCLRRMKSRKPWAPAVPPQVPQPQPAADPTPSVPQPQPAADPTPSVPQPRPAADPTPSVPQPRPAADPWAPRLQVPQPRPTTLLRHPSAPPSQYNLSSPVLSPPRPSPLPRPHNFGLIIKEADINVSAGKKHNLYSGISLCQGRKKYWVDEMSGSNNFMVYARGLSITWGGDTRYWRWIPLQEAEASDAGVEVAELMNVCWLHINGKLEMSFLTPGRTYEVVFVVMMNKRMSSIWKYLPVTLDLNIGASGDVQTRQQMLDELPKGKGVELAAGELKAVDGDGAMSGEMSFSLFDHSGDWKYGLIVKGVYIRPKMLS